MFEPLHLASSDRIYPSKDGFYVVIISSIINELRKLNNVYYYVHLQMY